MTIQKRGCFSLVLPLALSAMSGCGVMPATPLGTASANSPSRNPAAVLVHEEVPQSAARLVAAVPRAAADAPVRTTGPGGLPIIQVAMDPRPMRPVLPLTPNPASPLVNTPVAPAVAAASAPIAAASVPANALAAASVAAPVTTPPAGRTPAPAPAPASAPSTASASVAPASAKPAAAAPVPATPASTTAQAPSAKSPTTAEPSRKPNLEASSTEQPARTSATVAPREAGSVHVSRVPDPAPETIPASVSPRDFPWIPGAMPSRIAEETTVGVGARMYGRLFAKVEYGASTGTAGADDFSRNRPVALSQISCAGVTCLDAAREHMLQDAQRKGWRVIVNRKVAMQQSFLFQRGERAAWVEIHTAGPSTLNIEYALVPVQDVQGANATR